MPDIWSLSHSSRQTRALPTIKERYLWQWKDILGGGHWLCRAYEGRANWFLAEILHVFQCRPQHSAALVKSWIYDVNRIRHLRFVVFLKLYLFADQFAATLEKYAPTFDCCGVGSNTYVRMYIFMLRVFFYFYLEVANIWRRGSAGGWSNREDAK